MHVLSGLIFLTGAYPLWLAWRVNRATSLTHALGWAAAAWAGWAIALWTATVETGAPVLALRYFALCLLGGAGVAVLGARRPGVAAWNFVILGLLAVLLLSLAEGLLVGGSLHVSPVRTLFLTATLIVGTLNYLPTRQLFAALLLATGCGFALSALLLSGAATAWLVADWCLALLPWIALLSARYEKSAALELDRTWLDFRDRFGLVWGARLREQFNRAAANAGLPIELGWGGFHSPNGGSPERVVQSAAEPILGALMKRFGPAGAEAEASAADTATPSSY